METRYDPRALGRCVVALSSSGTLSMGHALNLPEGCHRVEMYLAYRLRSNPIAGSTSVDTQNRPLIDS